MSPSTTARAASPEPHLPTLLHIDSSPMLETSVTRRLTVHFVRRWRECVPAGEVIRRDLGQSPPPHPDEFTLKAVSLPPASRSPVQQAAAAGADALLAELEAADVVLIGAPLYNFSVPSGLKAWFDLVSRPGRTFRYGPHGHEGLLSAKTVVGVTSRGGFYEPAAGGPGGEDLQEALIRAFFRFCGLTDIRFVHADGQDIDRRTAETHEQRARAEIDRMFAGWSSADGFASLASATT